MALGNELTNRRQGLISTDFTPQLEEAGVDLIPGGATTEVAFEGRLGEILVEAPNGQSNTAPLSPDNLRTSNPLVPNQLTVPEDDGLTPEGVLAPSEIKNSGGILSKIGDVLSDPASVKLLANLGIAIGRGTPAGSNIGEAAIANAEETAKQRLRDRVNAGESPGDILIRGLSGAGRQEVLSEFQQAEKNQREQELTAAAEDRAERTTSASEANTQSLIESRDVSSEVSQRRVELSEEALELERQSTEVMNDLRRAQTDLAKVRAQDPGAAPSEDTTAKAAEAGKLASDFDKTIEGEQEVLTSLRNQLRRAQSSGRSGKDQAAGIQEQIAEQEKRISNLRTTQGGLRGTAASLLGAPVPISSEEEAAFLPPGTLIILNGRRAITE